MIEPSLIFTGDMPVASRYFLAKYVPDPMRCEPRNIGVILWTPSGAVARFLGEKQDGGLDLRRVPTFVGDAQVYRQWVEYWRSIVNPDTGLADLTGPLEQLDDDSLRARLGPANKAHWWLVPGGVLLDPVAPSERGPLLTKLFQELVVSSDDMVPIETVDQIVRSVIKALSLHKDPHFKSDLELEVRSGAKLHFDYGYVGQSVSRLWQELPTMPKPRQLEVHATAVAFKFEQAREHYNLKTDQMNALICMTPPQEKANREWLGLIGGFAQIHNVLDVHDRFNSFANLPSHGALEGTPLSPPPHGVRSRKRRGSRGAN